MSYEVEYLTLKRAGSKAVGLASDIEDLLTDMHMDDVEGAIPGGISGGVATSVSNDWKEASKTASEALKVYGDKLTETAVAYQKIEEANTQRASKFFGGL